MKDNAYLDTSALAKWYFAEVNSDAFKKYIIRLDSAIISSLVKIEMRCLCARRRRRQEISAKLEMQVYSVFENDIEQGHLLHYAMNDSVYERAEKLMNVLIDHPLRTLDALHLAVAQQYQITHLATADNVMAAAGEEIGFKIKYFGY
jgi:predicted nucleic acid-binding protein